LSDPITDEVRANETSATRDEQSTHELTRQASGAVPYASGSA
jgi:hypothetical protein